VGARATVITIRANLSARTNLVHGVRFAKKAVKNTFTKAINFADDYVLELAA